MMIVALAGTRRTGQPRRVSLSLPTHTWSSVSACFSSTTPVSTPPHDMSFIPLQGLPGPVPIYIHYLIYLPTYLPTYLPVSIFVSIHICRITKHKHEYVRVCIHTHTCMYIYIYIHTYGYICDFVEMPRPNGRGGYAKPSKKPAYHGPHVFACYRHKEIIH